MCRHCGKRIRRFYSDLAKWVHDDVYESRWCHTTVAEPEPDDGSTP